MEAISQSNRRILPYAVCFCLYPHSCSDNSAYYIPKGMVHAFSPNISHTDTCCNPALYHPTPDTHPPHSRPIPRTQRQGYNGIGGSRITPELNNLLGQSETPTPPLIEVASPGSAREASGSSNRYGGSKRFVSARGGLAGPSGGSSDLLIWENLLRNEVSAA